MDIATFIIIMLAAFIAYNADKTNKLLISHIKQSESDELLRQRFPHLFPVLKKEIREYFDEKTSFTEYMNMVDDWSNIKDVNKEDFKKWRDQITDDINKIFERERSKREATDFESDFILYTYYKLIFDSYSKYIKQKQIELFNKGIISNQKPFGGSVLSWQIESIFHQLPEKI